MPEDDNPSQEADSTATNGRPTKGAKSHSQSGDSQPARHAESHRFFRLPRPIKQIFDRFPLKTYPPNELPQTTSRRSDRHTLYIFATVEGARRGRPSYNPTCLKWQTYLRFCNIKHLLVPSNNHASPTGALPFLLPAATNASPSPAPVPSNKILRWISPDANTPHDPASNIRAQPYLSLLDHRVRPAYLHTLYLTPSNFHSVAHPLYIEPSTTTPLVRNILAHHARSAALSELSKLSPSTSASTIPIALSEADLYTESRAAFEAFSTLLGDENPWFFGTIEPSYFDACVFAYTYVILHPEDFITGSGPDDQEERPENGGWKDERLREQVKRCANLVGHCDRILDKYYPSS